ncbi:MAG: hypothetical protein AAGA93_03005 [Actinomycetota bacterium]
MDRVLRIIGVSLVAALVVWAVQVFDRSVTTDAGATTPSTADEAVEPASDDPSDGSFDGSPVEPASDDPSDGSFDGPPDGGDEDRSRSDEPEDEPTSPVDADGAPPRFLAAVPGNDSRTLLVTTAEEAAETLTPDLFDSFDVDGDYPPETDLVPGDSLAPTGWIEPGLYAAPLDVEDCGYELRRFVKDDERLIGQDRLSSGRLLVSLNPVEPDLFRPTLECRQWAPWVPLAEPLVAAGDGDYWVGDLAPGTWAVPEGCLWEHVVAFRGARLVDVTSSGRGPRPLVVEADTLGVRIRGCDRVMRLIEAAPDPGIGIEPGLEP